jgi:glycosyltransferase involved in cell wall biosynthesis
MSSLAIITPVYGNAASLAELASRIQQALAGAFPDYRLLFVVDASPDAAWEQVQALRATDPHVLGLLLDRNVGQNRAILAGLAHVEAERYAVLDADLQDPPEFLLPLALKSRAEDSTVFALRQGIYQSRGRMLTSRIFRRLMHRLTGLPPNAGTFFVLPREVAETLVTAQIPSPQVVIMAKVFSDRWSGLPFQREVRHQGGSAYSALGRMKAAWRSIRCAWSLRQRIPFT